MYLIKWTTKDGDKDAQFFKTYKQMEKFFLALFRKKLEAIAVKDTKQIGTIRFDNSQVPGQKWAWYLETEVKEVKMGRPAVKDKKQRVLIFVEKSVIRKHGGMAALKKMLLHHARFAILDSSGSM